MKQDSIVFLLNFFSTCVAGILATLIANIIVKYFPFFRIDENTAEIPIHTKLIIQETRTTLNSRQMYCSGDWKSPTNESSRLGYFFISFCILYIFIGLPFYIKTNFFLQTPQIIYLSQAKLIGYFLPKIAIGNHFFQWPLILITSVLYFPLLLISTSFSIRLISRIRPLRKFVLYSTNTIDEISARLCKLMFIIFTLYSIFVASFIMYFYCNF